MKYFIQGEGKINFTETDFVAEGGEGKLYAKGKQIFKIYNDPKKMIPVAKIQELARLDKPNIIRPQAVLLDNKNTPVGFSMARVKQSVALPRLFSNDFRNRQQIQDCTILIKRMMETIAFIHEQGCLMVDGNEMNYLVTEGDYETPYFIDVDSYQTPSFPATAIMPTIRDYHTQGFSKLTDWFAFATVACQLIVGIHPYKGKHPNKKSLEARMRANISIFNKDVSLPAAVRDFSMIPPAFYDWFVRLFEKGERLPPPSLTSAAPQVRKKVVQGTNNFIITLLQEFSEPIRGHYAYNGIQTVLVGNKIYSGKRHFSLTDKNTLLVYAPKSLTPLLFSIKNNLLKVTEAETGKSLPINIKAEHQMLAGNTLYILNDDNLTEIQIHELSDKRVVSTGRSWKIMPKASQVLDGMVYESVLGKPYLVIPYQPRACMVKPIPELSAYKVINGKYENGIAMLVAYKEGCYDLFCLRFDKNYNTYTVQISKDVEQTDINFIALENGIAILMGHDGEMEVFHRYHDNTKLIQDNLLNTDIHLSRDGVSVLFYTDKKLYRIKMK
jgi:hypothetical protein